MSSSSEIGSLHGEDLERLTDLLGGFVKRSGAQAALLLDRAGQCLASAGVLDGFDTTTFASLAAADYAAGDQLALLLGEEDFQSLTHQGDSTSMYLADVGGRLILAALFDGRTTLGLVRLTSRTTIQALSAVLDTMTRRERPLGELTDDWLGEAEELIERLFAD